MLPKESHFLSVTTVEPGTTQWTQTVPKSSSQGKPPSGADFLSNINAHLRWGHVGPGSYRMGCLAAFPRRFIVPFPRPPALGTFTHSGWVCSSPFSQKLWRQGGTAV